MHRTLMRLIDHVRRLLKHIQQDGCGQKNIKIHIREQGCRFLAKETVEEGSRRQLNWQVSFRIM